MPTDPQASCAASLSYTNHTLYKIYSCNVDASMTRFLLSLEVRGRPAAGVSARAVQLEAAGGVTNVRRR
jgi:hypothetical protein